MLTFDADKHIYYWNANRVPSVTEIISEWMAVKGADYYVNSFTGAIVHVDRFEAAREVGSAIHKACKFILTKQGLDWDNLAPALVPPLKQLEKWMIDFKVNPLIVERPMYSWKYGFAGTPDIVCTLNKDKHIALIDIKTGLDNAFVGVQTAAYEAAVYESGKIKKIIKRYELILPRDGNIYKFKPLTNKDDLTFFLSRLNQYNYLKKGGR